MSHSDSRALEAAGRTGPSRRRWRGWRAVGVTAAAVMLVVLGAGIAVALIPRGNTVTACYDNTTGALRVVDPLSITGSCSVGETRLSWTTWKWSGNYSKSLAYDAGDVVLNAGMSYVALLDVPSGLAPGESGKGATYWGRIGPKVNKVYKVYRPGLASNHWYRQERFIELAALTSLPEATYSISAKVYWHSRDSFNWIGCGLLSNGSIVDWSGDTLEENYANTIVLQHAGKLSGKVSVSCTANQKWAPLGSEPNPIKLIAISQNG